MMEKQKWCANDVLPSEPAHPGEFIMVLLDNLHLTQKTFAHQIGVSPSQLNEVLHGKRPVNLEWALLFEKSLGTDPEALLKMQINHDKQVLLHNAAFKEKLNRIRRIAAAL
jgi:addiction module HigA family antidote